jgi:hypothetical protein
MEVIWMVSNLWIIWWIVGLIFSLGLGGWLTPKSLNCIREKIKEKAKQIDKIGDDEYEEFVGLEYFSPQITGTIERLFFMILVAFNVSGTATAMVAWITVKMATDWLVVLKDGKESWQRKLAFSALLGSMISLFFALIGGLICRRGI